MNRIESNESARPGQAGDKAELNRHKYIGLGLIAASLVVGIWPPFDPTISIEVLSVIVGTIGLAFYAKAKNRSLWWCSLGLLPVGGPLLGLLVLTRKHRRKSDFPGIAIANIICCAFFVLLSYGVLLEFFLSVYLPEDEWYPRPVPYGVLLFIFNPLILFVIFVSLKRLKQYFKIPTLGRYRSVVIVEVILVGLFTFSLFQTFHMLSKVRGVMDARSEKVLSKLQVGMSRKDVEILMLEANAALIGPSRERKSAEMNDDPDSLHAIVQQALEAARTSGAADFTMLKQRDVRWVFVPREEKKSIQSFGRVHILGPFHDVSYEILVTYDDADRVQAARYVSSAYYDGTGPCEVVYFGDPARLPKEYRYAPCNE